MSDQPPEENRVYDYGPEKSKRDHQQEDGEPNGLGDRLTGAFILIGLGTVFLLRSFGIIDGDFNWWALFIVVPGIGLLFGAFVNFLQYGLDSRVKGQTFGAIMTLMVGFIFLFDLDWGKVWPLFLIVPGVAMLLGLIGDDDDD